MFSLDTLDDDPNIDLTPVIDVIFMLLIFFIMTTTFSKPVLEVILPVSESSASSTQESKPELLITVTDEGKIFYGDQELEKESMATLLDEQPETILNLYIDEKAPFEAFVRVIDVARTKRGDHFLISTQPRE